MCFIFTLLFTTTAYLSIAFTLFKSTFSVESVNTNPLYLSSGVAYIFLPIALILFFPEVLYGIKNTDGVEKKPQTELNEEELSFYTDLAKSIENYLHSEKPYLNPNFDLKDIANALGTTQKEISFACKHQLNKKFTDLRTHLRISHAKELLDKGLSENITIDAIGSNSGFKSRSTFYEAFKAETGMTPSQYLESI
jgi:AraC-like DNA-binding protein